MLRVANTWRVVKLLAALLVVKTIAVTVWSYRDYVPPDFTADFLLGRRGHFFGAYQWAFYVHIVAGPLALAGGLALVSEKLRRRWPAWHRRLGRVQVACVVLAVAPSGLWMAQYAATGAVAGAAFATLAVATAWCALQGWRHAVRRHFAAHRRWMLRCFALLGSAVVLRVWGGAALVLGIEGTYPAAAWLSWLLPLGYVELLPWIQNSLGSTASPPATVASARRSSGAKSSGKNRASPLAKTP